MTDAEWASFGDYVPWITDREAVQARVDEIGSWQGAALAYTRRKLNEILSAPTSFSVPGEYSETWDPSNLAKQLATLEALVPVDEGGAGFGVGVLRRRGRGRSAGYR
jgi:hypothetical protein